MPEFTRLRLDGNGPVTEVVLNNPGRLNAMDRTFFLELREAFQLLGRDPEVRTVVIWAEGRIFSSGLDLHQAMGLIPPRNSSQSDAARNRVLHELIVEFQGCISQVRKCPKPVIAAVHGMCLGGGLDLATACDFRLCSADAQFGIQETRMAMVADLGTLQRLGRIIGRGLVREMAFTGEPINAARAAAAGLVNRVQPDKLSLLEEARSIAGKIAANSPPVVQGVKRVLDFSDDHTEDEGLEFVAQWNSAYFVSSDLHEAVQSFLEKRDPKFRGD